MMLPINPVCDPKKVRKDGTSLIFFRYCWCHEKATLLNTEIAIPPKYWSKTKQCILPGLPLQYGNVEELNEEVTRQFRLSQDLIKWMEKNKIRDKGPFAKKVYQPKLQLENLPAYLPSESEALLIVENPLDIYYQVDEYIKVRTGKVSQETLDIYKTMKDHLKEFEKFRKKPVTFECLDFDFYDRFSHFLTYHYVQPRFKVKRVGLKQNSISKDMKSLKGFIQDRVNRKVIRPINMSYFKSPEEDADAIYLTFEEIAKINYTDLSAFPELKSDRNRFVLACLTGLRYSDFTMILQEDVRNGRLYLRQEKTEARVVIPLRAEAALILEELFKESIYKVNNANFNENIKIIGKLAGITEPITFSSKKGNVRVKETRLKADWITSHTGRRSFCTNEFLAGTPVKLIMKISGHKKEKDFYKYIKITAEEGAIIIERLWAERNAMQPLQQFLGAS